MQFTLAIESDNEAFAEAQSEVVRILRDVADQMESGTDCANIRDANGNTVGTFELLAEDSEEDAS